MLILPHHHHHSSPPHPPPSPFLPSRPVICLERFFAYFGRFFGGILEAYLRRYLGDFGDSLVTGYLFSHHHSLIIQSHPFV
ncbi:hypothetical protein AGABI1DRAFT_134533 [Agaricus bisporus var. burnettii JB137-S8]|uniref:Uncharacterized protein n=1 Tax=Agaricus bisporus var. burnettii (strain JB137-S8 / ATCC MYA-4627 / FGSC 10392) TaxID=597362 RepID=K5WE71_AGABU|nr:uncharacterized protein AGABI1DRAFT_134533 [Agaricus bisporus var. burnettii JB137-S8]EKM73551.1 hypothetical protein AGABI1DRAFT_134533 [Agaricus bisporus var. burnettii JB137-S8]